MYAQSAVVDLQERMKADVVLTSYETAAIEAAELRKIVWETMVVDEGHRLKNKDSRLYTVMRTIYDSQ